MKKVYVTLIIFLAIGWTFAQNPIQHIPFNTTSGIFTPENIAGNNYVVDNPFPNPEPQWVAGVEGNALRFNGYTTKVEGNVVNEIPNDVFSVSMWVAIEDYGVENAGLIARHTEGENRGWYASLNRFGQLTVGVFINGVNNIIVSSNPISRFEWHHIAFTINTIDQEIQVYLDGTSIGNRSTNAGTIDYPSGNVIRFGKYIESTSIGVYSTDRYNGILDEVKIFGQELSPSEVQELYNEFADTSDPDFNDTAQRFEGDFHRPKFHALPPANWTNEPHGLIYYKDTYHIFYQKNANGGYIRQQNWGYQTSSDLVKWTEQRPALSPTMGTDDSGGCWAGLAVEDDFGNLQLIYTGVDGVTAQMMLATANEDISVFEKYSGNPLVATPPAPYTAFDFRDPFVWKENGFWYMLVGSGLNGSGNSGGAVIFYRSTNLTDWENLGVLHKGFPDTDDSGVFWELPVFWKFGDKHVLIVIPTPQQFQPARMLYWTGTFENETFIPDDLIPRQLGATNGMLSPTLNYDEDSLVVGMGIIPDLLPAEVQVEKGWMNLYSLPRVYSLTEEGEIAQRPHPNLTKLRGTHYHFENIEVAEDATGFLENIQGRQLEIRATIAKEDAFRAGIIIAQNEDNTERTTIFHDWLFGFTQTDRSRSSGLGNVPKSPIGFSLNLPPEEDLDLHIFYDGSVIEVFINELQAYACRIYPGSANSTGIDLFAEGGTALFKTLDIWELIDMQLVSTHEAPMPHPVDNYIKTIFPNPTQEELNLIIDLPISGNLNCQVFDLQGRLALETQKEVLKGDNQTIQLNLSSLSQDSIFILKLTLDGTPIGTRKIILQK